MAAMSSGSSPKCQSVFIALEKKKEIHSPHFAVPHVYCWQTSGKRKPSSAATGLPPKPAEVIYTETEDITPM